MKNKDRYNLTKITFKAEHMKSVLVEACKLTISSNGVPVVSFYTKKAPIEALLEWLESEVIDY